MRFSWTESAASSTRIIEYDTAYVREELSRSDAFYVVVNDEKPVAFVMIAANWNLTAEILDVIVDAHWRNRGIGTALLERASSFARERDLRAVQWEIQSDNRPAIDFALHRGFRIAGYHDALYQNDGYESQSRPGFRGLAVFLTLPIPQSPA